MGDFKVSTNLIKNVIRTRYLIITLLVIFSVFLVPYFLPIFENYNPVYSINSDHDLGHSMLRDQLKGQYDIQQIHSGLDPNKIGQNSIYILNRPQIEISESRRDAIVELVESNVPVVLLGVNENLFELGRTLGIVYSRNYDSTDRVFDEVSNGGDLIYPRLRFDDTTQDYFGIVPSPLEYDDRIGTSYLTTSQTATLSVCYRTRTFCFDSYSIGFVNQLENLAAISDNWMFSNKYLQQFPSNTQLLIEIINTMNIDIDTLIFDESFYEWAPINTKGVENYVAIRLRLGLLIILIGIIGIVIPMIIGNVYGVFETGSRKEEDDTMDLEERLNYIHLDRLPAAPLSLEEELLVEEKLKVFSRGKFYFQQVATDLLNRIQQFGIEESIPQNILQNLKVLQKNRMTNLQSWQIIKDVNQIIMEELTSGDR